MLFIDWNRRRAARFVYSASRRSRGDVDRRHRHAGQYGGTTVMNQIDRSVTLADESFDAYAALPPERIAAFLEKIGEEILALGDVLIETASRESALPGD